MSVTSADLDAAVASAAAVIRSLPAPGLVPGAPLEGQAGLASAIPAPDSQAVSASLTGSVNGTIVLICHPELAAQVENGPIGPQTLVAGLETAMADAAGAISNALGAVEYVSALALAADVALANAAGADRVAVVPIASEGTPVGSVVLILEAAPAANAPAADAAQFESLSQSLVGGAGSRAMELLNDVEMGVTAELGRTRMTVRELLSMQPGSIVELDRAAGSPVDLLVNGTLVARGEVVVIDEEFGVRITEIIGYDGAKDAK